MNYRIDGVVTHSLTHNFTRGETAAFPRFLTPYILSPVRFDLERVEHERVNLVGL